MRVTTTTHASYYGQCPVCGELIKPGDLLAPSEENLKAWGHVHCVEELEDEEPDIDLPVKGLHDICETCHLMKPCFCEEG